MPGTPLPRQSGPTGSRLAQLLGQLDQRYAGLSHGDFAERLGRLFDLSDGIALDGATRHRPDGPFEPVGDLPQRLREDLLASRSSLLNNLARSFNGEEGASVIALPAFPSDAEAAKRPPFSPYVSFYQAHQRQMIAGIANLRLRCRRQLTTANRSLAHLAELDAVFESGLASYARAGFAVLPDFLEARYRALWQQRGPFDAPADWLKPGGWLLNFRAELRLLLLAELDARQEPVLGLLAAAGEQFPGTTTPDSGETTRNAPARQENNEVSTTP